MRRHAARRAGRDVSFDAFPPTADEPIGLSAGPNGTLFIKIDTNSNFDGLRMFYRFIRYERRDGEKALYLFFLPAIRWGE